jgi:hypothetical protein
VNPLLAVVALAVVAGAAVAVSLRDTRAVVLGLAVVAVATPFVAEPVADPMGLAARVLAAILGAELLWISVRDGRDRGAGGTLGGGTLGGGTLGGGTPSAGMLTGGSRIGWPTEVLLAASGAVVGFAAHGLGATAGGPALASATGFAVATLAVLPLLTGRDLLRLGVGLVLLLHAGLLVRTALGGTPVVLEQLVTAGLVAALGGALAALIMAARSDGVGGLDLSIELGSRRHREPDAHPMDEPGSVVPGGPR